MRFLLHFLIYKISKTPRTTKFNNFWKTRAPVQTVCTDSLIMSMVNMFLTIDHPYWRPFNTCIKTIYLLLKNLINNIGVIICTILLILYSFLHENLVTKKTLEERGSKCLPTLDEDKTILVPLDAAIKEINFIFEHIDSDNVHAQCAKIKQIITRKHLPWLAKYLINRLRNTNGFHPILKLCMKSWKSELLNELIHTESYVKINNKITYKEDKGLGNSAQGHINPVQLPTEKCRRESDLELQGSKEYFVLDWDPEQEESTEILKVTEWLKNEGPLLLSAEDMKYWIQTGEKKLNYDQTTEFGDLDIFKVVNSSKNVLDHIDDHDFRVARTKSNPFETIKNGIFQNRAAMKMANIDWACDFMFTNPHYSDGQCMLTTPSSLLYFADICAGPGGFSEYVLWRKSWKAKGVGFTLRNANDFKLNDFQAGSPKSFEPYYGSEEDGDIYKPNNILALETYVMKMTEGKGVHFVMADGGFSVEGQENFQEILSKRLYLCQVLTALSILRPHGHFMCKLFDVFTEFSAGLLFLLYRCFKQISIYKPVTSRPANSERYVICKWRLDNVQEIKQYLFNVNLTWNELESNEDILSIVPLEKIIEDLNFYKYIWDSNNRLGQIQAVSLSKIIAYTRDHRLADKRQKDLKKKCLELWEVNYDIRRAPFISDPKDSFDSLVSGPGPKNFLYLSPEVLNKGNLRRRVVSVYDWHCVLLSNSQHPTYFLSVSDGQVYEYVQNRWVTNTYLNISPGTLIYGELATELKYSDIKQRTVRVLHIIDAYKLGNVDISNEHYLSRIQYCKDFAKSMNKIESNQIQIRVKEPENMENITNIFKKIDRRWSKCHQRLVKTYELDLEKYCYASGILFIKATLSPWVRTLSDTHNSMYYRHPTKQSIYERANPVAAYAHFGECCSTNKIWLWVDKSGNTLKTLNPKLQLEPKDFDKFRLIK